MKPFPEPEIVTIVKKKQRILDLHHFDGDPNVFSPRSKNMTFFKRFVPQHKFANISTLSRQKVRKSTNFNLRVSCKTEIGEKKATSDNNFRLVHSVMPYWVKKHPQLRKSVLF